MTDFRTDGHLQDVALALQATPRPEPAQDEARPAETPSFPVIYEEYFDFVWRTVRRLGVQDKALDDAVQDVFVVVHRRLGEFEGRSSLRSWLFGIARRVAKDHRRRVERKERGALPPDGLADPRSPNPHDDAARAEAVKVLYAMLEQLDDDKREAFVLAELEQMTVPEISEALAVNVNTVYSRLRAARRSFDQAVRRFRARDRLGRPGPGPGEEGGR